MNVYLIYVLNECPLQLDNIIGARFAQNTSDSVFNVQTDGEIIYNNQTEPDFGNIADAHRGDIFVKGNLKYPRYNRNGKLIGYGTYQHYDIRELCQSL